MKQNVSWPAALLAIGIVLLVLAVLYHGAAGGGSQGRVSPQFEKLSPAEQQQALANAERARRLRGAPPEPVGR